MDQNKDNRGFSRCSEQPTAPVKVTAIPVWVIDMLLGSPTLSESVRYDDTIRAALKELWKQEQLPEKDRLKVKAWDEESCAGTRDPNRLFIIDEIGMFPIPKDMDAAAADTVEEAVRKVVINSTGVDPYRLEGDESLGAMYISKRTPQEHFSEMVDRYYDNRSPIDDPSLLDQWLNFKRDSESNKELEAKILLFFQKLEKTNYLVLAEVIADYKKHFGIKETTLGKTD